MVLADTGEDAVIFCGNCRYAANSEKAEVARPEKKETDRSKFLPLEEVYTPDVRTIEEVSEFLKVRPEDTLKPLSSARTRGRLPCW